MGNLIERAIRYFRGITSKPGYYSQFGQDKVIEAFFRKFPPIHKRFIEVGAFDGITYSNVRHLAEVGWSGICVEPVPENFEKVVNAYRGMPVLCLNCACGSEEMTTLMHVSTDNNNPSYGSDVATLHKECADSWNPPLYNFSWREISVQVRPLGDIAREFEFENIDLLCIDSEGHDLEVLHGLDLKIVRPSMILVETVQNEKEIKKLLLSNGYRVYRRDSIDTYFVT